ncbi:MAG: divalent-cation tolerance protein CutA [Deltaproteobacteria bacterium]|nr:divalent-cation tolerance protein CutA [Deltaproteobacteria bacterium]
MKYCIVLTTCPNDEEADKLALQLIHEKLAACVQLSPIKSYYRWKNEQHIDTEIRLLIKTKSKLYESVEQFIKKHHSYDVPQIVQLPVTDGSDEYLDWIDENTIK